MSSNITPQEHSSRNVLVELCHVRLSTKLLNKPSPNCTFVCLEVASSSSCGVRIVHVKAFHESSLSNMSLHVVV